MRDARKFIEDYLSHEYDPVKAREYYLRTRKLKGRKPGQGVRKATGREASSNFPPTKTPAKATAVPTKPVKSRGERLTVLKARLDRLTEVLDLMESRVAAAKARSGIETDTPKDKAKKAESSKEASKDKTSTEKKKDAKAAKERYEKNKDPETAKGAQAVQDEIEEVQKKIAAARDELAAALAKARASSPKPSTAYGRSTKNKEGDRQNGA